MTPTQQKTKKVGILVAISDNNEIWIDKKRVETTALKISLQRLYNENPKGGMVIQADNESNIEVVAKVADVATDIGIRPVAISVEQD